MGGTCVVDVSVEGLGGEIGDWAKESVMEVFEGGIEMVGWSVVIGWSSVEWWFASSWWRPKPPVSKSGSSGPLSSRHTWMAKVQMDSSEGCSGEFQGV